jgi:hypothetical protein
LKDRISVLVTALREIRKREREIAKLIDTINRAFYYFAESGNPLPALKAASLGTSNFCTSIGITHPGPDDEAWNIPVNFKTEESVIK